MKPGAVVGTVLGALSLIMSFDAVHLDYDRRGKSKRGRRRRARYARTWAKWPNRRPSAGRLLRALMCVRALMLLLLVENNHELGRRR